MHDRGGFFHLGHWENKGGGREGNSKVPNKPPHPAGLANKNKNKDAEEDREWRKGKKKKEKKTREL